MVHKLIHWAVDNPLIVLLLGVALVGVGGFSFFHVNVEAYPDPAPAIVEVIARTAGEAIRQPDVRQKLEPLGLEVTGLGPAEMARILRADYDKWGPVIRASGFKADGP